METINRMNKAEMGMDRNDFYAYKKQRALEMAQQGASVQDIANDLGLGEKDMYAFLSRNFGGIRRMRHMDASMGTPTLLMAGMSTAEGTTSAAIKTSGATDNKTSKQNESSKGTKGIHSNSNSFLNTEKEKILSQFRKDIEKDVQTVVNDMQKSLNELKVSMLKKFKEDFMREISTMK